MRYHHGWFKQLWRNILFLFEKHGLVCHVYSIVIELWNVTHNQCWEIIWILTMFSSQLTKRIIISFHFQLVQHYFFTINIVLQWTWKKHHYNRTWLNVQNNEKRWKNEGEMRRNLQEGMTKLTILSSLTSSPCFRYVKKFSHACTVKYFSWMLLLLLLFMLLLNVYVVVNDDNIVKQ